MAWSLSIKKRSFIAVSLCVLCIYGYFRRSHVNEAVAVSGESVTIKPTIATTGNYIGGTSAPSHIRYYSPTEILETHFPQCQIPSNTSWIQWLRDYGFYTPTTTQEPRYDHWCPVMKARYNCAWPLPVSTTTTSSNSTNQQQQPQPPPQHAYQYHFVWKHPNHSQVCDLNEVLDFVGGPSGMIRGHVLLQGNSYLRQVWEALVCAYPHPMTHVTLYRNGPPTSMAYIQSRSGKLITPPELGEFVVEDENNLPYIEGCHGPSPRTPMAKYYRPNVSVPSNRDKCTDDMATVQFHHVQFTFIFHPSRFQVDALQQAYTHLGIVSNVVDTMVYMGDEEKDVRNLTITKSKMDLSPLLPLLIDIQNRTLGQYFGADNPWITHPPDNHPCMPGIPDDEANILLWLLLLGDRL